MNLPNPNPYRTLVEAMNKLREQGYTESFKLESGKLTCLGNGRSFGQDDLKIIEIHRFEGASDPADMSVLFAVECCDGTKGTVVSSYGANADHALLNFMKNVKIEDRTEVAGH